MIEFEDQVNNSNLGRAKELKFRSHENGLPASLKTYFLC